MMERTLPARLRSFSDPAPPRFAAKAKLAPEALRQLPLQALRCGGRVPRKNIHSRVRNMLFQERGGTKKNTLPCVALLATLLLMLLLSAGRPALAATEIHGADSSFRSQGITILWAILKGPSEETSFVHIRILHDKIAAPGLRFYRIEAVDPFSKEREWVDNGEPLGSVQTLKIVRTDFRDKTERWLHFYADRESLEKGRTALTIFYHGVPDTAPEILTEVELEAYLVQALSRIK